MPSVSFDPSEIDAAPPAVAKAPVRFDPSEIDKPEVRAAAPAVPKTAPATPKTYPVTDIGRQNFHAQGLPAPDETPAIGGGGVPPPAAKPPLPGELAPDFDPSNPLHHKLVTDLFKPQQSDTTATAIAKTALSVGYGVLTPDNLVTMAAAGPAGKALQGAVNLPRVAAVLSKLPQGAALLKAADVVAAGAVPASFAGLNLKNVVEQGQVRRAATAAGDTATARQATMEEIASALLAGVGAYGASVAGGKVAEAYPGAKPFQPTPAEATRAAETGTIATPPAAQAQATATALEQAGRNLAASAWKDLRLGTQARVYLQGFKGELTQREAGPATVSTTVQDGKSITTVTADDGTVIRQGYSRDMSPWLAQNVRPVPQYPELEAAGVPKIPTPGAGPVAEPPAIVRPAGEVPKPGDTVELTIGDATVKKVLSDGKVNFDVKTPTGTTNWTLPFARFQSLTKAQPVANSPQSAQVGSPTTQPIGNTIVPQPPGAQPAVSPPAPPLPSQPSGVSAPPLAGGTTTILQPSLEPQEIAQGEEPAKGAVELAPEEVEKPTQVSGAVEPSPVQSEAQPQPQIVQPKKEKETEEPAHEFSSTQANLTGPVADKLLAYGKSIHAADLTGDQLEKEPHITVKFGLHGTDPEEVRALLKDQGPITAMLGKTSVFPAEETGTARGGAGEADVLKVDINSPSLHELNKKISDALPHTDTHPVYQPHATIAYLKPGKGKQYEGKMISGVTGHAITIDKIVFSGKDGKQTEIALTGKAQPQETKPPVSSPAPLLPAKPESTKGGKPESQIALHLGETGYVLLSSDKRGVPDQRVPVKTADQASAVVRRFIETHELGASEEGNAFTGGELVDAKGAVVGRVSYNGRVWDTQGKLLQNAFDMEPGYTAPGEAPAEPLATAPTAQPQPQIVQPPKKETEPKPVTREEKLAANKKRMEEIQRQIAENEKAKQESQKARKPEIVTGSPSLERGSEIEYRVGEGKWEDGTIISRTPLSVKVQNDRTGKSRDVPANWIRARQASTVELQPEEIEPAVPATVASAGEKPTIEPETPNVSATRPGEPEGQGPLAQAPAEDVGGAPEAGPAGPERPLSNEPDAGLPGGPGGAQPGLPERPGEEPADRVPARRGGRSRAAEQPPPDVSHDYRITATDLVDLGGEKAKARANLDALRTLAKIKEEGREATPEEQSILVKYVGWGQLSGIFDPWKTEWKGFQEDLRTVLKDLTSSEEYAEELFKAARHSTMNAHFTTPEVVSGMWRAMEHLGFNQPGANVLEPSAGVGHFFGLMPAGLLPAKRTGVELDPLTGDIARLLYPSANIQISGFERTALANNYFDVAISNVPFGKYGVHDATYKRTPMVTASIHNYFFAKALDKVRPGGIVAFVTSSFTMDARDPAMRRYLAGKADLLGAIRLPGGKKGAFAANAGTEVTTDILFLQKREPQTKAGGQAWEVGGAVQGVDENGKPTQIPVNEYYAHHPEMMLGQMALQGTMYGPEKSRVLLGELTPAALDAAIQKLPANIYREYTAEQTQAFRSNPIHELPNAGSIKDGGFGLKDDQVIVRKGANYEPAAVSAPVAERIKSMMGVRDAVREVFRTQLTETSDEQQAAARKRLNTVYDAFVKRHGPLNAKENVKAFFGDPDAPLLASLEDYDRADNSAKKRQIFTQRTIEQYKPVDRADSPSDALAISLAEFGRIDWMRMQELTGAAPERLQADLSGQSLIFRDPDGQRWETADEYLSGNVRVKLALAENAAKTDPDYRPNVEALQAVQPKDLTPHQINARLGASWIPTSDVKDFIGNLLDLSEWQMEQVQVGHAGVLGNWSVRLGDQIKGLAANTNTWGHDVYSAHELIERALNLQYPTIYKEEWVGPGASDTKRVVDKKGTLAAQEKQEKIKDRFKQWLWSEPERAQRLAAKYNEEFNNLRLREYNGAHLKFPGMARLGLRNHDLDAHQKNAVWRVIQGGNTLLAHVVGAGKTFEMIAAAMELRRMGLIKKPMFVVPNHLVEQWGGDFLRLYPSANVFVAGKDYFSTGNRQAAMSRIATGNYDAVIVAHRSFQFLPVSDATFTSFIQEQLHDINQALADAERDEAQDSGQSRSRRGGRSRKSPTIKQLEAAKARFEKQIEDRAKRESQDKTLSFEELGVDHLFVDEAHMFKNLYYPTKMTRVAGLPNSQSDRAMDMFIKTQYMVGLHNGRRGVVFATGTPISNSMAEMFTMQRYLQMAHLKDAGMQAFDSWAQNFGEPVTGLELAPEGSGYRINTRFARFINLPELLTAFRTVADVKTAQDLNLPKPKLKSGKAIVVSVPASDVLKQFVKEDLVPRAEAIRSGKVRPDQDNMLAVVGEGRKAALDMRLLVPSLPDHPGSKVNVAIDKVAGIWKESKQQRSTQLVFLDLSTPRPAKAPGKGAKDNEPADNGATVIPDDTQSISVYQDIRKKLIRAGVPPKEIAFIHDAKSDADKQNLFSDMNSGRVRILLGSTEKMGAGMNVQRKLLAIHHLDAPWRPSDVEQRNGRGERQGNENPEIAIYHYVTEDSFDAYMWQTILSKANTIAQAMTGDLSIREVEDIGVTQMSAAEAMAAASGNPEVRERIGTEMEVRKLEALSEAHEDQKRSAHFEVQRLPGQIRQMNTERSRWEGIVAQRNGWPADQDPWTVTGAKPKDATERNKALVRLAVSMVGQKGRRQIGTYKGFPVEAIGNGKQEYTEAKEIVVRDLRPDIEVDGLATYLDTRSLDEKDDKTWPSLASAVRYPIDNRPDQEIRKLTESIGKSEGRFHDLQGELDKPFEHAARLAQLQARLLELNDKLDIGKADTQAAEMREEEEGGASAAAQPQTKPSFQRSRKIDTSGMKAAPNLSPEAAAVQKLAMERVKANPQALVDEYRSRFGDHFNPDNAAELFPEYASSPENRGKYRVAVGGAAGWVADEAFRQRLAERDHRPVAFTAGGTASGKSTFAGEQMQAEYIVFDSTFSNYELSKRRLQEALDSGRNAVVYYVYRDPLEAWEWSKIRAANEGAGRTVTVAAHAFTHKGAASTVARLAEDFKDNPAASFRYFENSTAHGMVPGGIEVTQKGNYTNLSERLQAQARPGTSSAPSETATRGAGENVPRGTGGLREQGRDRGGQPLRGTPRSLPEGKPATGLPESTEEEQPGRVTPKKETPEFQRALPGTKLAPGTIQAHYRNGTVYVNRAGMDALASVWDEKNLLGMKLESYHVVSAVKALEQKAPGLVAALEHAAALHPRVVVTSYDRPLSDVIAGVRHEWWHSFVTALGQHLGKYEGVLIDHPLAQRAALVLADVGYGKHEMASEIGAHLAAGQYRELGLNRPEAQELWYLYVGLLDLQHGKNLEQGLKRIAPMMKGALRDYTQRKAGVHPGVERGGIGGPDREGNPGGAQGTQSQRPGVQPDQPGPGIPEAEREVRPAEPLSARSEAQPPPQIVQPQRNFEELTPQHAFERTEDFKEGEDYKQELRKAGIHRGEAGFIHAPLLTGLPEYLAQKFGSDAPKGNYSGLGAVEKIFLPGQRLAEVEKASKPVFRAAIRAGGANSQESVIMQQALPAIRKALEGSGVSWEELHLAYTESRLQGLRQRFEDYRDQASGMDAKQLQDALFNRSGSDASPFLIALSAIEGRQGLSQDLAQTAMALAEHEDWDTLRPFLEQAFDDAAHRVAHIMEPGWFGSVVQAIQNNPQVKEADRLYHEDVEGPMRENHALNEGFMSDALGPLNRYIPLIAFDRKQRGGPGRRLPYRAPKNPANFFATGLSEGYDQSMEAFAKRLAIAIRANDKASLINTLKGTRWMQKQPANWDGVFHGPDGIDYEGIAEEMSPGRTILTGGKTVHTPAQMGIMPRFLNAALKPILAREPQDPNQVAKTMGWLNMLATKGPWELIFHSAGVLGALYSNTPFLGGSGLDKALSLPLVKWVGIRAKLAAIDPTTPENLKKLQEMAEAGAIPSRYGKVTYSKEHAAETGSKLERFSFGPMLYGPKGIDARARVLMYDIFQAAFPHGSTIDLYHFVNQIGNYTPEFQGAIEQAVKKIGLGPFATAGMTRLVNGVQAWTGTGPMPKDNKSARLWWLLTASGWMTLALWLVAYKKLTGKWPLEDNRAKLFQIPVSDQFRYSKLGRARWGDGPETGYLTFGAVDPLSLRGARLLGAPGFFETHQLHGTFAQSAEAAQRDAMNSLVHPMIGPFARSLFVGLSGSSPYITGLHDQGRPGLRLQRAVPKRLKPGFLGGLAPTLASGQRTARPGFASQKGAQAAAAIRELNSFAGDLGEGTGMLGNDRGLAGVWWLRGMLQLASPALPQVMANSSNPYSRQKAVRSEAHAVGAR